MNFKFKPGKILEKINLKDKKGKIFELFIRYPKMSDAKHELIFVNKLRKTSKYLGNWHFETLKSEKDFLKRNIENMKKKKGVLLSVYLKNILIASVDLNPGEYDDDKHIALFGVGVLPEFQGLKLGTLIGKLILEIAKKETNFELIRSSFYRKNKASAKLHENLGFKKYGELSRGRKRPNFYDNEILVHKFL
ncbi:MAG TPA: GNAT family protein [archaeon]|nr:GNAT family protein [archaeon]